MGIPAGIAPVTCTYTHKPAGLPIKTNPRAVNSAQKWVRYANFDEFHEIGNISLISGPKIMFLDLFWRSQVKPSLPTPVTCMGCQCQCHSLSVWTTPDLWKYNCIYHILTHHSTEPPIDSEENMDSVFNEKLPYILAQLTIDLYTRAQKSKGQHVTDPRLIAGCVCWTMWTMVVLTSILYTPNDSY